MKKSKKKASPQRSRTRQRRVKRPSAAAKISVPRLAGAVPRERLFTWLDKRTSRPCIWISGPPGSGKTTLVASYLERSRRTTLWYRIDEGDRDLPTVFHNLREAARVLAGAAAERLPLLTPEYLLDVPTFARNFVRALFALLDTPATLVIDNVHDAGGTLDTILKIAVAEAPRDVQLIAISRNSAPPVIQALEVTGSLAILEWDRLRLTLEEAETIAATAGFGDDAFVRSQHILCDGWVAGFTLLLEHARQLSAEHHSSTVQTRAALFNYFSGELFAAAPADAQQLLLCTALLPSFTLAQAATFADEAQARAVMDWLFQRNFFIHSRAGVYQYHDLFREFLLDRGRATLPPAQRRALLARGATAIEQSGQLEPALALQIEAEAWPDAARLICTLAQPVLQQGRGAALDRWICALPAELVSNQPWLLYWLGNARLPMDPGNGRTSLQAAFALFEAAGDRNACLLACAGIFQSFFLEWGDQHPLDPWLEKCRALVQAPGFDMAPEIESHVYASMVGLILRHAGDPLLLQSFERARQRLARSSDPVEQVSLAFFVIVHCQCTGKWVDMLPVLSHLDRLITPDFPPLLQLMGLCVKLTWRAMCADYASESEGRREIERFFELSERSGIHTLDVYGLAQGIYFALNWQDLALAESQLERMRKAILPQRSMDIAHYGWLCAVVALERGDPVAHAHMQNSLQLASACGTRFGMCQNHLLNALIQLARGDVPAALREVDLVMELAQRMRTLVFEYGGLLIRAYVLLRSGNEADGLQALREGLSLGRATGQSVIAPTAPTHVASYLYAYAFQHGIEVDYIRRLVATYHLRPPAPDLTPAPDLARWPWPVRIYTLGRLSLVKNDTPVRMSGKAQKKPLHVLQALIALGGRGVAIDTLIRQVWPSRGASARANLNVALMRLRRLLGNAEALVLSAGKLTLNDRVCWVDAWAFERALRMAEHEAARQDARRASAIELYRGSFLQGEDELVCVTRLRDRLARKFRQATLAAGQTHEDGGRFDRAVDTYRFALEHDELAEELHRRLIYCEWKRGQRAEAIRSYQRCRDLLARHLRIKPSRETERLYQVVVAEQE